MPVYRGGMPVYFSVFLRGTIRTTRFWRGGRAVECTGLENRHRFVAYPGFESLPLRQIQKTRFCGFFLYLTTCQGSNHEVPQGEGHGQGETVKRSRGRPGPESESSHPLRLSGSMLPIQKNLSTFPDKHQLQTPIFNNPAHVIA